MPLWSDARDREYSWYPDHPHFVALDRTSSRHYMLFSSKVASTLYRSETALMISWCGRNLSGTPNPFIAVRFVSERCDVDENPIQVIPLQQ